MMTATSGADGVRMIWKVAMVMGMATIRNMAPVVGNTVSVMAMVNMTMGMIDDL